MCVSVDVKSEKEKERERERERERQDTLNNSKEQVQSCSDSFAAFDDLTFKLEDPVCATVTFFPLSLFS